MKLIGFFCAAATAACLLSAGPAAAMCADGYGCNDTGGTVVGNTVNSAGGEFGIAPDYHSGGDAQDRIIRDMTDPWGNKVVITLEGNRETYYPDGSKMTGFLDGSRTIVDANGKLKQMIKPDGTTATQYPDGSYVITDLAGNVLRQGRTGGSLGR